MPIPTRLVRTVPENTSDQVEAWWAKATQLHPGWEHVTYREPVDHSDFPITGHLFDTCESGAQKADLIRLEALWQRGGCYVDSDYELYKPLDPLLAVDGWCGWEDAVWVCNAAMGFMAGHPALTEVIQLAIRRHDEGTWPAGIGAFTDVMKTRTDVLLLPPQALYPWHWTHKQPPNVREKNPWSFGGHHWLHSWKEAAARA